jgi:flagellar biosynthesis anti-sigma factor FlgM
MNPTLPGLLAGLKSAVTAPIQPASPSSQEAASMKIDPSKASVPAPGSAGGAVRPADAAAAASDARGGAPVLSSRNEAGGGAPFDSTRVADLRRAVEDGRYQPSSQRIADALIGLESALGSRLR